MHSIRPKHLLSEILDNMKAGLNTMIWGGPGTGKSDIPLEVTKGLNQKLLDFRANLFDPVDVRGIPYVAKFENMPRNYTRWAVPDIFPIVERDGYEGLFFIDELPTAPPATQNAFLQLLLTRRVGDYELPEGWSIIAAGNRLTDSAAVYQMPSPVRNRLAHYELEPHLDDWCTWAIRNGIDQSLISFLRFKPVLLYDFNPESYAFPTPRSWAFVDKRLKLANVDEETLYYGVSALVGDGAAGEYIAFRKIHKDLPDVDALIANPQTYKPQDNVAVNIALAGALASQSNEKLMDNIVKVMSKMQTEYQVIGMKLAIRYDKTMISHPAVRRWITDSSHDIL